MSIRPEATADATPITRLSDLLEVAECPVPLAGTMLAPGEAVADDVVTEEIVGVEAAVDVVGTEVAIEAIVVVVKSVVVKAALVVVVVSIVVEVNFVDVVVMVVAATIFVGVTVVVVVV